MHPLLLGALAAALLWLADAAGAVPIDSPSDQWNAVDYLVSPDWADDQATGADEADIVGDASHAAVYTFFDGLGTPSTSDGILGFRLRLGADENPAGFKHVAVVGIDADLDDLVDILLVVDNKGGSPEIAIRPVDGTGASPAETGIDTGGGVAFAQTAANYSWQPVSAVSDPAGSSTDVDGDGETDYFLSWSVDFQALVNELAALGIAGFDQSTMVRLVAGTSTNSNSVNQDWAGPNGGTGSTATWSSLGGLSEPRAIPEPDTVALLGLGLAALSWTGRPRPGRRAPRCRGAASRSPGPRR